MDKQTEQVLYWLGNYALGHNVKKIKICGAALTPELRKVLHIDGVYGKYGGIQFEVVPSYWVVND